MSRASQIIESFFKQRSTKYTSAPDRVFLHDRERAAAASRWLERQPKYVRRPGDRARCPSCGRRQFRGHDFSKHPTREGA